MADWTTIANSAIDGDSPITQTLMEALRDNPQAIAEGAVGAPRIQTGAYGDNTITRPKLQDYAVGDYILAASDTEVGSPGTTYAKVKEIVVARNGTVRIAFDIVAATSNTTYGRIYKNGVAFGTERSNATTSYSTFSEDLSVSSGDLIQLYVRSTPITSGNCRNFRVKASNPFYEIVNM